MRSVGDTVLSELDRMRSVSEDDVVKLGGGPLREVLNVDAWFQTALVARGTQECSGVRREGGVWECYSSASPPLHSAGLESVAK